MIDWPDDIVGSTICGELDQCSGSNASKASPALLSVHAAMPALMRTMSPLVEQAVLRSASAAWGAKTEQPLQEVGTGNVGRHHSSKHPIVQLSSNSNACRQSANNAKLKTSERSHLRKY